MDIDVDNSTLINFETNDQGTNLDLDSEINFYGNSYNQIVINPNGWVGFSEDNTNGAIPPFLILMHLMMLYLDFGMI